MPAQSKPRYPLTARSIGQLDTSRNSSRSRPFVPSNSLKVKGKEFTSSPALVTIHKPAIAVPAKVPIPRSSRPPLEAPLLSPSFNSAGGSSENSASRFEAFLARSGKHSATTAIAKVVELLPTRASRQSLSRARKLSKPAIITDEDEEETELDRDFILQFAKEHQLELADEVTKELASPTFSERQDQVFEGIHSTLQTPKLSPALALPSNVDSVSQASSLLSVKQKPPRPPRSERRLSFSPNAPQTVHAGAADSAAAFEDADENVTVVTGPLLKPVSKSDLSMSCNTPNRLSSLSSTRPKSLRRERALSLPPSPAASPILDPSTDAERSISFLGPDEIAQVLAVEEFDQAREDYERDRRLSSLFKGLGIHNLESQSSQTPCGVVRQDQMGIKDLNLNGDECPRPSKRAHKVGRNSWRRECPDSPKRVGQSPGTRTSHDSLSTRTLPAESRPIRERQNDKLPSTAVLGISRSAKYLASPTPDYHDMTHTSLKSHAERREASLVTWESLSANDSPTLDQLHHNSFQLSDQRASLGITDSVLASILASESFCLPSGLRLSMEQISARLNLDVGNAARFSLEKRQLHSSLLPQPKRTVSSDARAGIDSISLDYAVPLHSQVSEVANVLTVSGIEGNRRHAEEGPYVWQPNSEDILLRESGLEETDTEEAAFGTVYPSLSQSALYDACALGSETSGNPEGDFSKAVSSSPLAPETPQLQTLHPPEPSPFPFPDDNQLQRPELHDQGRASSVGRKRSLSLKFQRLTGSVGGAAARPPRSVRRRLPSFFGGSANKVPSSPSILDTLSISRAASPSLSIAAFNPPLQQSRPRAYTGPAQLLDIANAVTNTPGFPQLSPTQQQQLPRSIVQSPRTAYTWRSTIPAEVFEELVKVHSNHELRRQEVIWELCQTEDSFVTGLMGVVRLFSEPLRTSEGQWITGVPFSVSRFLDCLDDIVCLHSHLAASLRHCRSSSGIMVMRIAEALLPFVPQLEVHQPYLVRFEAVTKEIDEMTSKPNHEFGEYVRMQQALPECGAMSLTSFLLKPVQRLMKYPLFFKVCSIPFISS